MDGWALRPKESQEMLMGERDWIEVNIEEEGVDGWGSTSPGVGFVAIFGVMASYVRAQLMGETLS